MRIKSGFWNLFEGSDREFVEEWNGWDGLAPCQK